MAKYIGVIAVVIAVCAPFAAAGSSKSERTCFPAFKWGSPTGGVDAGLRPCVRITRVFEDGSFTYKVTNSGGGTRYSGSVGAKDR